MKKMVLVVGGIVLLLLVLQLAKRVESGAGGTVEEEGFGQGGGAQTSATEGREASAAPDNESVKSVQSGESLLARSHSGENDRSPGGTGQGLQDAGGTIGQTGKSAPQELSASVKALLGQDGEKHNYSSLLSAINALDADMSATDVAALREMLNFSNDRFLEKMRSIEINAVKNDVLDKLLRQKDLPEGLGLQMVEMAGNAENDPVWRDYCIQFMTPVYERLTTEYTEYTEMGERGTTKDSNDSAHNYFATPYGHCGRKLQPHFVCRILLLRL